MKISVIFSFLISLVSGIGSESYRGSWNAMDSDGNKFELYFSQNHLRIKNSNGSVDSMSYNQTFLAYENGLGTYGLNFDDGAEFNIIFP